MSHSTLRRGSPHVLQLRKLPKLFTKARERVAALEALRSRIGTIGDGAG